MPYVCRLWVPFVGFFVASVKDIIKYLEKVVKKLLMQAIPFLLKLLFLGLHASNTVRWLSGVILLVPCGRVIWQFLVLGGNFLTGRQILENLDCVPGCLSWEHWIIDTLVIMNCWDLSICQSVFAVHRLERNLVGFPIFRHCAFRTDWSVWVEREGRHNLYLHWRTLFINRQGAIGRAILTRNSGLSMIFASIVAFFSVVMSRLRVIKRRMKTWVIASTLLTPVVMEWRTLSDFHFISRTGWITRTFMCFIFLVI